MCFLFVSIFLFFQIQPCILTQSSPVYKELICITVVGRCLTRKHSGLSAVSIQGELWIFFLTQLSTSERGVGWVEKPSIRCIFRKSHFDLLGVVGFGNMLTNDFYLNIFLQLRKKILC